MANLLPQSHRHTLKRERIMRILIVSIIAATCVVAVIGVLIIPAYVVARANESGAAEEIEILQKILELREQGDAASEARQLRDQLQAYQAHIPERSIIAILDVIGQQIPNNVQLVGITINEESVKIDGVAGTRDSLLGFRTALEATTAFGAIDIPISTLANQFDLSFSLNVPFESVPTERNL